MPRNPYYRGPASDHFDGIRFFNAGGSTDRSLSDVLRWRLSSRFARWPARVDVSPALPQPRVAGCVVTMVGHATVLIQVAGLNILTDPVWSERASPVGFAGPKRVTPPGIRFDDLPPIDAVLLSHSHYDHLDLRTLSRLHRRDKPRLVTPLGNDTIVRRAIPDIRAIVGDWGGQVEIADNVTVSLVPANHWSARGTRDRRMSLWSGFMLRTPETLIYFAGDTGYGDGAIFRRMRHDHGAPDLALLPIGAYAPRWFMEPQHADPAEAVRIMRDVEARQAIAIHWGCFQLTDEPREEPPQKLQEALAEHGIAPERFRALEAGAILELS
ncbi:MBL fold metallo-hydrolase [Ancylobacter sp. SL191]|nr:MBL fold metallo-hydrolase [Ancylobacter sp. SL191]